jgi:hypothetical protein
MNNKARLRITALVTTAFIGGLAAGGVALRQGSKQSIAAVHPVGTPRVRTEVIHETHVKTVHVRRRPAAAPARTGTVAAAPVAPAVQPRPVVVEAPRKVTSRVSPTGARGEGEERGEGERGDD